MDCEDKKMTDKKEVLDILQHVRHDWLNKIQLIKGYISLGRLEKAESIIADIIMESQQESRITNLKLPEFAYMLITHNWQGSKFLVEYEVAEQVHKNVEDETSLVLWMRGFFQQLESVVHPMYENRLAITVKPLENQNQFLFHFSGKLEQVDIMENWISNSENRYNNVHLLKMNETELIIEFIL